MTTHRAHRHDARTLVLYAWAILCEFRLTILFLTFAVLGGGFLFWITADSMGRHPLPSRALYAAWASLLGESHADTDAWYLLLVESAYPVAGFVIFGEGLVRLMALVSSRRRGGKEWMTVMASTYRNHVVLCGLGHVGYRVLQRLLEEGLPVVALDRDEHGRFLGAARSAGVPILVRDVRDDTALDEAGVPHARVIVIATDDDLANLEVALDARRVNPKIRIIMRLFDQQVAAKLKAAGFVDEAFSASALAAPVVAEMASRGFRQPPSMAPGTAPAAPG